MIRPRCVVLLLLVWLLAACTPAESLLGSPEAAIASPRPTARLRATPVPTVAGRPSPGPIVPPVGLRPGRTIAFVSDQGGTIDLWLMDIETNQRWRLTNDAAIESFPVWSPDGTTLAYVVEDERANRNLWLLDLRTGLPRQVTHEAPPFDVRRAAWLRGGQALAYDTGKPFDRRPELRVVTIQGAALAPILPDPGSIIWDWSTNGTTLIAAVGDPLGQPKIVIADAVPGASLHPAASMPVGFAVDLSPAGRRATYNAPPLSDDQITWVLDLASGQSNALNENVRGRRYDHDFAWLPDAHWLVFVHGVGGVTDGQGRLKVGNAPPPAPDGSVGLWLTDREGQRREQLTHGSADAAPRPSPDGAWVAYLSDTQPPDPARSDIWLVSVVPGSPALPRQRNLTYGEGNNWSPAWMPLPVGANGS